jgi:hypothetical protein
MERCSLEWVQDFTMPNKKPPARPASAAKTGSKPPSRPNGPGSALNPRLQTDNRWQRSKRYGWDSR